MPDGENGGEGYDDRHRAFLQAFMARGTLTFSEARPLLAAIETAHGGGGGDGAGVVDASSIGEAEFQAYMSAASRAVAAFDYEVRSTLPQNTSLSSSSSSSGGSRVRSAATAGNSSGGSERVYALINGSSDALTQLATTLAPDELAFVKRVLDAMFEANNSLRRELCALGGKAALQLHGLRDGGGATQQQQQQRRRTADGQMSLTQGNGNGNGNGDGDEGSATHGGGSGTAVHAITMSQAQAVLDALVSQGWFEVSRKGNYSLTPRALMELRTWLVETYNDEEEDEEEDDDDDDDDDEGNDGELRRQPRRRIKTCAACKEIVTVGQRCPRLRCLGRLHDACTDRYFTMQQARSCPVCKEPWAGHGFVGERALAGANASVSARTSDVAATAATPATQRTQRTQRPRRPTDGAAVPDDELDAGGTPDSTARTSHPASTRTPARQPRRSLGARPGRRKIVSMDGARDDDEDEDEDDDGGGMDTDE